MRALRATTIVVVGLIFGLTLTGCPKDAGEDGMDGGAVQTDLDRGEAMVPDSGGVDGSSVSTPRLTADTRNPMDLQRVHFDFDSSDLTAESRLTLQENFKILRSNTGLQVEIEGHCDERGTNEYNLQLGWKRANAVKGYLVELGIESGRLDTISYGEELPLAEGSGESTWAQNRRAQFRVK